MLANTDTVIQHRVTNGLSQELGRRTEARLEAALAEIAELKSKN